MSSRMLSISAQAAPLLCAAHCLAVPLLAAATPLAASAGAEWGMMWVGAAVSVGAALEAARMHRRIAPPLLVAAAVVAWLLSLWGAFAPLPEPLTTVLACTGVAAASLWGARLRHHAACHSCACPADHGAA